MTKRLAIRKRLILSAEDLIEILEACDFKSEPITITLARISSAFQDLPTKPWKNSVEKISKEMLENIHPEKYNVPKAAEKMERLLKRIILRLKQ